MATHLQTIVTVNATMTPITVKSENADAALPKVVFAIFASLSVFGNTLVCWVFLKNSQLLRLGSTIFIFSLAIVDILTGILILGTPTYNGIQIHMEGTSAALYCSLVHSEYFIWTFGIASCYIIAALSVERLCMVSAAVKYKRIFTPNKTIIYIILINIWAAILNAPNLYQYYYNSNATNLEEQCGFRALSDVEAVNSAIYFTSFVIRFALPLVVMIFCYTAFMRKIRTTITGVSNATDIHTNKRNRLMLRRLTRMSVVISIAFCICWLPNQIYFALIAQHLITYDITIHMFTKTLVSMNSAINPVIYAATNVYFYNELAALIKYIFCCKRPQRQKLFVSV
ncbi:uncharacterized protein TRIADDRAFT_55873 [Trichoplax adhaerens]|uniref:G-protein coupled receptors family 1 profile domain-containing protein n=1 Tax=Trichoplax adhaerens TaxID=10228 RepID=B3RW38_TRIAD|nr:hypothetical protein TRIADDRAFT_55873 [Trichoplax adhaerens]EDV25601.1 hypothetical protein TRIADDRAFT_55873 [Trichoplax adhaerens]|eukprot:XP_002111634.1 hypothetical protein TRIADDRAFT_55873 [Trichoplax adhaerens]